MVICEFCNNNFSSKGTLKVHQTKSQYCIEIQKTKGLNLSSELFICDYCKKQFNMKHRLETHNLICREKQKNPFENKIKELSDQNILLNDMNNKINLENSKQRDKILILENDIKHLNSHIEK